MLVIFTPLLRLTLLLILAGGGPIFAQQSSAPDGQEALLYLSINEQVSDEMLEVYLHPSGGILVKQKDLEPFGLDAKSLEPGSMHLKGENYLNITRVCASKTNIDKKKFQINAAFSPSCFPQQTINALQKQQQSARFYDASQGGFVNYNATFTNHDTGRQSFGATNELNAFNPDGRFFTSFFTNANKTTNKRGVINRRIDTYWASDDMKSMQTIQLGDATSTSSSTIGATRFAGVKWGTNFRTQPNYITYFQPTIEGTAALPTVIDVYAKNTRIYREEVKTGNYSLHNLPMVSGSGDLIVEATDITGKRQTLTIPYFIAPTLLKPGLSEYAVETGVRRERLLEKNADYRHIMASGTYRYGITPAWTAGMQTQAMHGLNVLGIENNLGLSSLGLLSLSGAASHQGSRSGWKTGVGYSKQIERFNFGTNVSLSRKSFADVSQWPNRYAPNLSTRTFAGMSFESMGSVSASYTSSLDSEGKRLKNISTTYSLGLMQGLNFNAVLSKTISAPRDTSICFTITCALGSRSSVSGSYTRNNKDRKGTPNVAFRSSASDEDKTEYGVGLGYTEKSLTYQTNITHKETSAHVSVNASGNDNNKHQQYVNASGAVIRMGEGTYFTEPINESIALVNVGIPDVKVYRQNRLAGTTDAQGKALVPNLGSYHKNIIKIDKNDLPMGAILRENTKEIILPARSGVIVDFDPKVFNSVTLVLRDERGDYISEGAELNIEGLSKKYIVGYNGIVFINSLSKDIHALKGSVESAKVKCFFEANLPADMSEVKATCYTQSQPT